MINGYVEEPHLVGYVKVGRVETVGLRHKLEISVEAIRGIVALRFQIKIIGFLFVGISTPRLFRGAGELRGRKQRGGCECSYMSET